MIDDEYRGFRVGRKSLDHIFTLKQIGEKAREKTMWVFIDMWG